LIDISPLVGKIDDPSMVNDEDLLQVVQMLDDACREAGFFYVVKFTYLLTSLLQTF
jgi:isopenicillin N synthase-like dioxygenase